MGNKKTFDKIIPADEANKAYQLFDAGFILKTYGKKILMHLPEFKSIEKIKVEPHKKLIWEFTYHVVVEYKILFKTKDGLNKSLSIFCSAHSSEPRKNVYDSLKFLWKNGFNDYTHNLVVPHPLFYSKNFKGTFYVGVKGKNLYHYIKEKDFEEIESIVKKAAVWFAKLHKMPVDEAKNFSKDNSRIKTVRPGMEHIFEKLKRQYPQFYKRYKRAYVETSRKEEKFLASTKRRWLVHGDAHPENVIKISRKKISVIDYTDLCLTDFARDLGSFSQQLDYKFFRKVGNEKMAKKIKNIFIAKYLESTGLKMDKNLRTRIDNYYNWTALRTVAFLFLKHSPSPTHAEQLLNIIHKK